MTTPIIQSIPIYSMYTDNTIENLKYANYTKYAKSRSAVRFLIFQINEV